MQAGLPLSHPALNHGATHSVAPSACSLTASRRLALGTVACRSPSSLLTPEPKGRTAPEELRTKACLCLPELTGVCASPAPGLRLLFPPGKERVLFLEIKSVYSGPRHAGAKAGLLSPAAQHSHLQSLSDPDSPASPPESALQGEAAAAASGTTMEPTGNGEGNQPSRVAQSQTLGSERQVPGLVSSLGIAAPVSR